MSRARRCPHHSHCQHTHRTRRRLNIERLEARSLLAAVPLAAGDSLFSGMSGVCNCPICTGAGLDALVEQGDPAGGGGGSGGSLPQGTLPILSSRPTAAAKLFLDFDGNYESSWGSWSNVSTPAYDTDGNLSSFSSGEQAAMYEIWQRVAEDFAPFNIDVTTVDPGSRANQVVAHIAIGGNWSDWYGSSAGGVAYIGGFYNSAPNVGFAFEDALGNGYPKYVAEAASHEAGHLFGLQHQALWSDGSLVQPYNRGDAAWAPIMGTGYYSERTTWHYGTTSSSPNSYQDDLAILAGNSNGFGYVADDFGSTIATAALLPVSGTSVQVSGLIGRSNDVDVFAFTTGGGTVDFNLAGDAYSPNLDGVLELWSSAGSVLTTVAPGSTLGASLSYAVGAGTFYLVARGMGDYGDMGRYTITGNVPALISAPEITVRLGSAGIFDGQTVDFGTATVGSSVDRTFTVVNDGSATLTLSQLSQDLLPAGFSIVSNLGANSLAPGGSTTFTLRFAPTASGSYGGAASFANNDADENPFDLVLTGSGVAAAPEISVLVGSTNLSSGATVSFGTTDVGAAVTRTITIRNDGTAPLSLAALDPAALPAGYSIVANLGAISLAPGESTTFTLQLDATAAGTYGGSIAVTSSDADENPFTLNLSGVVSAPFTAHKQILDNGDPGTAVTGAWTHATDRGYQDDIDSAAKGNGSMYATWTFTGLPTGEYEVYGTWTAARGNATNAPFSFNTGSGSLTNVKVNQRIAPSTSADGYSWSYLGKMSVNNGWAIVKLANKANGTVVADAIRVVQLPPAATREIGGSHRSTEPGASSNSLLGPSLASAGRRETELEELPPIPVAQAPLVASTSSALDEFWSSRDVASEDDPLDDVLNLLSSDAQSFLCKQ